MATNDLKTYRITWDDGTERYRKLDGAGYDEFKRYAEDKTNAIKSVTAAEPKPINATGKA